MAEPPTQYAKTSDGVSIAYWTYGDGPPLVLMPSANISPTRRAWRTPEGRRWFEGLANGRTLIRYDNRAFGDSQHGITTFPSDYQLLDLAAVVDRLGLKRLALFGYLWTGPVAIAYAARNPERVSHLILWCTSRREGALTNASTDRALEGLRHADFDLYIETMALVAFGWSNAEQAREYAQSLRESLAPEALDALAAVPPDDATELLPHVQAPTLVLHRSGLRVPPLESSRDLAARISNAKLVVLEGETGIPYIGDTAAVLAAIDEFLDEAAGPQPSTVNAPAGLVTILFTDIEDSTALTQRLGDAKAQELVRAHNTIVREALSSHTGSEIKHTGDGIFASFPTTSGALECAMAIQRAVAERDVGGMAMRPYGSTSGSTRASRSRRKTICSAQRYSSPGVSATRRRAARYWCRTWCDSSRRGRASCSRIGASSCRAASRTR